MASKLSQIASSFLAGKDNALTSITGLATGGVIGADVNWNLVFAKDKNEIMKAGIAAGMLIYGLFTNRKKKIDPQPIYGPNGVLIGFLMADGSFIPAASTPPATVPPTQQVKE